MTGQEVSGKEALGKGPSSFDWMNAVWAGSEQRAETTLNSQLVDSQGLAMATSLQAILGSSSEKFAIPQESSWVQAGDWTIADFLSWIGNKSNVSSSHMGIANSIIANMQQDQSLNTQTAGQGVQMETNQATQVDTNNQTSSFQLLSALVNLSNQCGGFQLN